MRAGSAKTLYAGAGVALAAGLVLGAAMRPDLLTDERPAGPQILPDASAARSSGPFDDSVSYAGFAGSLPDYVLGTDWRRAQAAVVAAVTPPIDRDPAPDRQAVDDAPSAADAGVDADSKAAAPQDIPPAEAAMRDEEASPAAARAVAADLEAEAPPEASGDTRATP